MTNLWRQEPTSAYMDVSTACSTSREGLLKQQRPAIINIYKITTRLLKAHKKTDQLAMANLWRQEPTRAYMDVPTACSTSRDGLFKQQHPAIINIYKITTRPSKMYKKQINSLWRTFGGRSRQECTWMYPQRIRHREMVCLNSNTPLPSAHKTTTSSSTKTRHVMRKSNQKNA